MTKFFLEMEMWSVPEIATRWCDYPMEFWFSIRSCFEQFERTETTIWSFWWFFRRWNVIKKFHKIQNFFFQVFLSNFSDIYHFQSLCRAKNFCDIFTLKDNWHTVFNIFIFAKHAYIISDLPEIFGNLINVNKMH